MQDLPGWGGGVHDQHALREAVQRAQQAAIFLHAQMLSGRYINMSG